jgi:hypothetical protein
MINENQITLLYAMYLIDTCGHILFIAHQPGFDQIG